MITIFQTHATVLKESNPVVKETLTTWIRHKKEWKKTLSNHYYVVITISGKSSPPRKKNLLQEKLGRVSELLHSHYILGQYQNPRKNDSLTEPNLLAVSDSSVRFSWVLVEIVTHSFRLVCCHYIVTHSLSKILLEVIESEHYFFLGFWFGPRL